MKRLAVLIGLFLLGLMLAGFTYLATNTEGEITFEDGATLEDMFDVSTAYSLTVVDFRGVYTYGEQVNTSMWMGYSEGNAQSLTNEFWQGYEHELTDTIADTELLIQAWGDSPARQQRINDAAAELVRFAANEKGCWNRGDCPALRVLKAYIETDIVTFQSIEAHPAVASVVWMTLEQIQALLARPAEENNQGRLSDETGALPDSAPGQDEWTPSNWLVEARPFEHEGGANETRRLTIAMRWDEDKDLAGLGVGRAFRFGVTLENEQGTYYWRDTIGGVPRLKKWGRITFPGDSFYAVRRGVFGGAGKTDYVFGLVKAEDLQSDTDYTMSVIYPKGDQNTNGGDVVVERGSRACPFRACTRWPDPALALNIDENSLNFPGLNTRKRFGLHLPILMKAAVTGGKSDLPQ